MVNKHIVGLAGLLLMATSASSLADSGHQSIHERVVERILKPCEGKKAGDKVVIVDHHGGYIYAQSDDEQTSFVIHLPVKHDHPLTKKQLNMIN